MMSLTILILRSILANLQETLKRRWRYLIPAESQIHNHMLIPDYQDIKFQDFRYSDGFECYQVIKIGRTYTRGASGINSTKQRTVICYSCKGEDAYDSDCDELNNAKVALMANLSPYSSDALAKINLDNKSVNDTLTAELERYKEQVKVLKEGQNVDLKSKDNVSESYAQSVEIDHLRQTLSEHLKEKESLMQTNFINSPKPTLSSRPTKVEVPKELPKVSMVNTSVQKLKHHLASFDVVVKERTIATAITEALKEALRKLKGKALADDAVTSYFIDPEMLYEEAVILKEIVEQGKSQNPLNVYLDSALKLSTSASESQPSGNTKKAKIQQPLSSTQKNKVDAHPRIVKTSLKNKTHTIEPKGTASVITTTTEVPYRKSIAIDTGTPKPVVTLVYSRKPKISKSTDLVSKSKVVKTTPANKKELTRQGLDRGLPKLKFEKDHLCSACAMGKSKKKPHKPKSEDTNQEKLYLLHMDLYGLMRVTSVNGKRYILVIVDDCSQFTWVKCLTSRDEAPDFIIKFLKMIQVRLKVPVRRIKTYNGTEFVNQMLREYYEKELLTPPPSIDHPTPKVISLIAKVVTPEPAASTGSPSSTTVDQDASSPSNSQSSIIPNDVEDDNHDLEVGHMNNDPFFSILILEVPSDQSSSKDVIHIIVHPNYQIYEHNSKWTKDHPLDNIIGELARPVSTRLQLHEQALFFYYDTFLTSVEPKMYKDALTQSCWIEAMQEELNEFERLEPNGFVDTDNHVYKLKKALYGLKQAISAWFDMLSSFLISQDFSTGSVDPTRFIRRDSKKLLLSKYALESLKKYGFDSCDLVDTPTVEKSKLEEDKEGKTVDPSHYRSAYRKALTCGLRGTVNRGLWYPKDSLIALTAFADADHAGCQDT
nr:retrovirus-related Pol polyprotein from transposon TNT 1-94 [Tanacetum cinerariifolium]